MFLFALHTKEKSGNNLQERQRQIHLDFYRIYTNQRSDNFHTQI